MATIVVIVNRRGLGIDTHYEATRDVTSVMKSLRGQNSMSIFVIEYL